MNLLIVAATPFEIAPTIAWLEQHFEQENEGVFKRGTHLVQVLVTGVGCTATAFRLGHFFAQTQPDWALNIGIAGAFDASGLSIGDVVQVVSERFGDLGVEEANGQFTDMHELGLSEQGILNNPFPEMPSLSACHGLTVNKVHGSQVSIQLIQEKYPEAQLETMEGAAFFYACLAASCPFAAIRSISNRVEPRNREAWDLPLAIENLNQTLIGIVDVMAPVPYTFTAQK